MMKVVVKWAKEDGPTWTITKDGYKNHVLLGIVYVPDKKSNAKMIQFFCWSLFIAVIFYTKRI